MTPTMLSPAMTPDEIGIDEAVGLPLVDALEDPRQAGAEDERERRGEGQEHPEAEPRGRGEPLLGLRKQPLRDGQRRADEEPDGDALARHGVQVADPDPEELRDGPHLLGRGRRELRRCAGASGEDGRVGHQQEVAEHRRDRAREDAEELRDELPPRVRSQQVAGLQIVEQVRRLCRTRWT